MLNKYLLFLLGLIIIHVFILTKLIYFPYPELFIYPYLVSQGLKPYLQILDQHFPGLMFLPINLDNLGMNTPEIARVWSIIIVVLIQLMLFITANKILKSKWKALLVNAFYLIWQPFFEGWVLWIDSFLPLFLLPAFYFLNKKNYFWTGLFLGMAIIFKQVIIPLSGLVLVYIFWEQRNIKKLTAYLLGLLSPIVLMLIYLFSLGVIKDFWYWTVVFNLTTFAQSGKQAAPTFAHLLRVGVVFGGGLILVKFLNQRSAWILLMFMFGALLAAFARFDFVHFQPALPFAILATVYGLDKLGKLGRLMGIGYLFILIWWLVIFYKGHLGDKILFFDKNTYELAAKVKQYTKPGERIFVFGPVPHLYQMTKTKPAGDIFVFQFPWFLTVAEDRILEGIKKDNPEIVVSDRTVEIEGQKITDFAKEIDKYINKNYQIIDQVGKVAILRRKSSDLLQ